RRHLFVPPLTGLASHSYAFPALTRWATLCRASRRWFLAHYRPSWLPGNGFSRGARQRSNWHFAHNDAKCSPGPASVDTLFVPPLRGSLLFPTLSQRLGAGLPYAAPSGAGFSRVSDRGGSRLHFWSG